MVRIVGLSALLLGTPGVVIAQPRGFAGGALASSPFDVSNAGPAGRYNNDGDHRRVTGVVGELGWFVDRRFAVGFEASMPFDRRAVSQEFGYTGVSPTERYRRISGFRERTIFFALHGRLNHSDRISVMWVGAGGLVLQDALERHAHGLLGTTTVYGPFGDVVHSSALAVGGEGGADLSIKVAPHVSVVPQFRVLYIDRGDAGGYTSESSFASLGIARVATRIGVGLRASF